MGEGGRLGGGEYVRKLVCVRELSSASCEGEAAGPVEARLRGRGGGARRNPPPNTLQNTQGISDCAEL